MFGLAVLRPNGEPKAPHSGERSFQAAASSTPITAPRRSPCPALRPAFHQRQRDVDRRMPTADDQHALPACFCPLGPDPHRGARGRLRRLASKPSTPIRPSAHHRRPCRARCRRPPAIAKSRGLSFPNYVVPLSVIAERCTSQVRHRLGNAEEQARAAAIGCRGMPSSSSKRAAASMLLAPGRGPSSSATPILLEQQAVPRWTGARRSRRRPAPAGGNR